MMRLLEEYTATYGNASVAMRAYLTMPDVTQPDLKASGLRVDVISAQNFPQDVFVWEKFTSMLDDGDVWPFIRPVCVAKPSDLSVYPAKAPMVDPGTNPPFYRDNFLSFYIESPDIVIDTWEHVKLDVTALVKTVMQLGGPPA